MLIWEGTLVDYVLYMMYGIVIYIIHLSFFFFILNRYTTKESAAQAIVALHNTEINGQPVKCSWGKESNDASAAAVAANQVSSSKFFFHSLEPPRFYEVHAKNKCDQISGM
jgi:hypothetical protein